MRSKIITLLIVLLLLTAAFVSVGYYYSQKLVPSAVEVLSKAEEPKNTVQAKEQKAKTDYKEGGKYVLKNEVKSFEAIKYAGFNLLNLANNHILDYYDKGLYDTLEILDKNNIAHAGAGKNLEEARKPAVIEKKGLKIGMLSYTDMAEYYYKGNPMIRFTAEKNRYGVVPRDYKYIKEDVDKLRSNVDILIVSFHWGVEDSYNILPEQTEMAHKLLDQGADIILGHHPHQFQGIEIYKGKPLIVRVKNTFSSS